MIHGASILESIIEIIGGLGLPESVEGETYHKGGQNLVKEGICQNSGGRSSRQ